MTPCVFLLVCLLAIPSAGAGAAQPAQSAETGQNAAAAAQIQRLIPRAAGMPAAVFEKIARMSRMPRPSDFDDQPLTIVLLFSPPARSEAARKEFRYLDTAGLPKPAKLAQEIAGSRWATRSKIARALLRPYATMIHANRITSVTCKVEGDRATGAVSFRVPELYEGRIPYVARRKGEAWQIVEFRLPGHGFRVLRDAKGKWKREELKPKGGGP